jgi:hypothetical protein
MSRGAWRYAALEHNSKAVIAFCNKFKFDYEEKNGLYQIRIDGLIDVYPVRQKWHWLKTGERGEWNNINELKRVMIDRLPDAGPDVPPAPTKPLPSLENNIQIGNRPRQPGALTRLLNRRSGR